VWGVTEQNDQDSVSDLHNSVEEKGSIYPDEGFVLAELDYMKPPGEALTPLAEVISLTEFSYFPSGPELDHVIYDVEGRDYDQSSLATVGDLVDGSDVDQLRQKVTASDTRQQRLGLYGVCRLAAADPDACSSVISSFVAQLESDWTAHRAMSLEALTRIAEDDPTAVTPAIDLTIPHIEPESQSTVQPYAVEFLLTVSDDYPEKVIDAVPKLAALLQHDAEAVEDALLTLKRIAEAHPDAVAPAIPEIATHIQAGEPARNIRALGTVGMVAKQFPDVADDILPTVAQLLDSDPERVQANAAGVFSDIADVYPEKVIPSISRLASLSSSSDEKIRHNVTLALARTADAHPTEVTPVGGEVRDRLTDDFWRTQVHACNAVAAMQLDQAVPQLEELGADADRSEVKEAASVALQRIRSE